MCPSREKLRGAGGRGLADERDGGFEGDYDARHATLDEESRREESAHLKLGQNKVVHHERGELRGLRGPSELGLHDVLTEDGVR